jgi:phosphoribosylformimino-5-aminoimidazole carboxamide ribotide isomerase
MLVIPAIDLKEGRCVRLRQGQLQDETVFGLDPAAMARRWQREGASCLHVVDLDAAVSGRAANAAAIAAICREVIIPVQMGGGLRSEEDVEAALALGVSRLVLGTMAVRETPRALALAERYPGRILVSLDALAGKVASDGWTKGSERDYLDLARSLDQPALAGLVFTDISRDGMGSGPNLEAVRALCAAVNCPVIASGGVHNLEDIKNLLPLAALGLHGVITGRAIYEGTLDLGAAIALAATPPAL